MKQKMNPDVVLYNKVVMSLPLEEREPFLERRDVMTARVRLPADPRKAAQELMRSHGITFEDLNANVPKLAPVPGTLGRLLRSSR